MRRGGAIRMLVLSAGLLGGCQVQFVAQYDQTLDQDLSATFQDIDALLTQAIGAAPRCDAAAEAAPAGAVAGAPVPTALSYAAASPAYDRIDSEFATLQLRADAQPKNTDTADAVAAARATFDRLRARHAAGTLDVAHARAEYCILRADFRVLTQMELAKKR